MSKEKVRQVKENPKVVKTAKDQQGVSTDAECHPNSGINPCDCGKK